MPSSQRHTLHASQHDGVDVGVVRCVLVELGCMFGNMAVVAGATVVVVGAVMAVEKASLVVIDGSVGEASARQSSAANSANNSM